MGLSSKHNSSKKKKKNHNSLCVSASNSLLFNSATINTPPNGKHPKQLPKPPSHTGFCICVFTAERINAKTGKSCTSPVLEVFQVQILLNDSKSHKAVHS